MLLSNVCVSQRENHSEKKNTRHTNINAILQEYTGYTARNMFRLVLRAKGNYCTKQHKEADLSNGEAVWVFCGKY
jgi:hypothetical protein